MTGAVSPVWPLALKDDSSLVALHGFFINGELAPGKGHRLEANLAFIAMAVAWLIAGGGMLSIDMILTRHSR